MVFTLEFSIKRNLKISPAKCQLKISWHCKTNSFRCRREKYFHMPFQNLKNGLFKLQKNIDGDKTIISKVSTVSSDPSREKHLMTSLKFTSKASQHERKEFSVARTPYGSL